MVEKSNNENETLLDKEKKTEGNTPRTNKMSFTSDDIFSKYDCGWCGYYPGWLQIFNRPLWAVFFIGLGALVEGMAVNGMLHFFISTIEKRFEMPSYQAGLMSGAFDIASLIFLIPVTYLGGRRQAHKPLYIAVGMVVMGIGSLIFALPHFINGPHKGNNQDDLCRPVDAKHEIGESDQQEQVPTGFSVSFWVLFFGNFLHGAGAIPLFTLCITFIDESVPPAKSSMFIGFYYSLALFGPAFGYALGAILIRLPVDFPYDTSTGEGISNASWVGCWWLGFILTGILAFIVAFIIFGMPAEIAGAYEIKLERDKALRQNNLEIKYQRLSELPKALFHVLTNLTYLCISVVSCCEGLLLAGFGVFMPKILESEFNLNSTAVSLVMGTVALPAALIGLLLGGWVVRHYEFSLRGTIIFDVCCISLSMLCVPGLLIGCPSEGLVGVNKPYFGDEGKQVSLWSECNSKCGCSDSLYNPVCGVDHRHYFSPCFAGCLKENVQTSKTVYWDCACIPKPPWFKEGDEEATNMPCITECPLYPLFIILFFFYQTFTFTALVPAVTAMLRAVNVNLKTLALGVSWILSRLLGTIPGPIFFGSLLDASCLYWYSGQAFSTSGVCIVYDHTTFRWRLAGVTFCWKVMQIIFFCFALLFSSRSPPNY